MTLQAQIERDAAIDSSVFKVESLTEALKVRNAIIFIYARWSGTAIQAWRSLTKVLSSIERIPAVIVVDADELKPAIAIELLGHLPQGKGETFWVKNGNRVAMLSGYREADSEFILENTRNITE